MGMMGAAAVAMACAGRSNQSNVPLVQDARCSAVADTVAKYVSEDALPAAQLAEGGRKVPGQAEALPAPLKSGG